MLASELTLSKRVLFFCNTGATQSYNVQRTQPFSIDWNVWWWNWREKKHVNSVTTWHHSTCFSGSQTSVFHRHYSSPFCSVLFWSAHTVIFNNAWPAMTRAKRVAGLNSRYIKHLTHSQRQHDICCVSPTDRRVFSRISLLSWWQLATVFFRLWPDLMTALHWSVHFVSTLGRAILRTILCENLQIIRRPSNVPSRLSDHDKQETADSSPFIFNIRASIHRRCCRHQVERWVLFCSPRKLYVFVRCPTKHAQIPNGRIFHRGIRGQARHVNGARWPTWWTNLTIVSSIGRRVLFIIVCSIAS